MDLSVLNLFASVGAPSLAKAFGEVDTGPPEFGGPPLFAVGPQKGVAIEPNAQAQVLDLLKQILKADAPASNPALSSIQPSPTSQTPVAVGYQLGDEWYSVSKPSVKDVLAALGIQVPEGFNPDDADAVKKAVAEAIVGRVHPVAAQGLLTAVLHLTGTMPESSNGAAEVAVGPYGKVEHPEAPHRAVSLTPIVVRTRGLEAATDETGQPVTSADDVPPFEVPQPRTAVPIAANSVPQPTSAAMFSTDATKVEASAGIVDPKVTEALRVVELTVESTPEKALGERPMPFSQTPGLQKAPTKASAAGERPKFEEPEPLGQPIPVPQDAADQIGSKKRPQPTVVTPRENAVTPRTSAETPTPVTNAGDGPVVEDKAARRPTPVTSANPSMSDEDSLTSTKEVNKLEEPEPLGKPTPHVSSQATDPKPADKDTKPRTLDVPEIKAKVVEQVQELAALRGNHRVTIRLQPDDLGTITVAVRAFGDGVEAQVSASNDDVRHALHAQRNELVQSVESKGLSLNSFTVGKEPGPDAWQQQRHGNGQGQDMRQEFARSSNAWGARHDQSAVEARPRFSRLSAVGLDTLA